MGLLIRAVQGLAHRRAAREEVDLEKSQWWARDELEALQLRRLKYIVRYAYASCPGYREKFDAAGVKPSHLQTLDDLRHFPIVTREELQNDERFVERAAVSATLHTGGSTGTSLEYYESEVAGRMRTAAHRRGWSWMGYQQGRRLAVIASAQGAVGGPDTLHLSGDLTRDRLEEGVSALREFRPQHLRGYVGSLYILARYVIDHDIGLDGIDSVNTISENLDGYQRAAIEEAFRCRVFEEYCCNDGGACAWECEEHTALHYVMERSVIEEVDGEIIATDLWNLATPFVRYRNGDAVRFLDEACPCGRALPLLRVRGRDNDFLLTREGIVSPTFLMHHGVGLVGVDRDDRAFKSGIRAVQYVQRPGWRVVVNVVRNDWCTAREIQDFESRLARILPGLELELRLVDDIPSSSRGKRGFVINEDPAALRRVERGGES